MTDSSFVGDALPADDDHTLETAVLHTVAYADVFDYPLKVEEIHRYLEIPASLAHVKRVVNDGLASSGRLIQREGYFNLPGREGVVAIRKQRAERAAQLWPLALAYGRRIANLPFVRMVALTGSLAMDNADSRSDLDYFIITTPDRLWLCRAMVVVLVRWAAQRGDVVCPNYFLAENALALAEHNLFVARELAQMAPLHGLDVYQRLRQANAWSYAFLPNAEGPPPQTVRTQPPTKSRTAAHPLRSAAEATLRTPLGAYLDRWEMKRKVRKFQRQYPDQSEAAFSPAWCKGHFEGHAHRILDAFSERVHSIDEVAL